jgi:hypothetical protein
MISDQQKWRGQNGKLHAPILSRLASPPPPPAMAPPHSCGEPPSNGQTLPVTRLIACYHVPLAPSPLLHLQVPARWSGGGADGGLQQLFRRTCARGALRPQPPTLPTHPLLHLGAHDRALIFSKFFFGGRLLNFVDPCRPPQGQLTRYTPRRAAPWDVVEAVKSSGAAALQVAVGSGGMAVRAHLVEELRLDVNASDKSGGFFVSSPSLPCAEAKS